MNNNKYDIREFNEWLKSNPKDSVSWGINDSIKSGKFKNYFFNNSEEVKELETSLTWGETHLLILKEWMKIKDNEESLKNETEFNEKVTVEKTESFSKQSFENKEKKQLEEIYNILFPNQNYDFDKLKEKLEKLRIHDLSLEIKKERLNYENLINSLKESTDDRFSSILDLFLTNEDEIINNSNNSSNEFLRGKKEAYKNVLDYEVSREKIEEVLNVKKNIYSLEEEISELNEELIINESASEENYCLIEQIT